MISLHIKSLKMISLNENNCFKFYTLSIKKNIILFKNILIHKLMNI